LVVTSDSDVASEDSVAWVGGLEVHLVHVTPGSLVSDSELHEVVSWADSVSEPAVGSASTDPVVVRVGPAVLVDSVVVGSEVADP